MAQATAAAQINCTFTEYLSHSSVSNVHSREDKHAVRAQTAEHCGHSIGVSDCGTECLLRTQRPIFDNVVAKRLTISTRTGCESSEHLDLEAAK
jgi:hypothetical protein